MSPGYKDITSDAKCTKWGGSSSYGHSRSLEIAPFEKVHTSSYYTSTVNMSYLALFLRHSETSVENHRF